MKSFLMTGASGFISSYLARELKKAGCRTAGVSHSKEVIQDFDVIYPGKLGTPIDTVFTRESIDGLVHCAYTTGKGDEEEYRVNTDGTISWAEQAQQAGVKTQIFLSSLSARDNVSSAYGRSKREIEKWFIQNGQIVFRLGLVIGNGGMFQRLVGTVQKYPLIPLLDNGTAPVYPLGIRYLSRVIRDTLISGGDERRGRIWHLQQPQPVRLREVLSAIRSARNQRRLFVPIPSNFVLRMVELAEKLPIKGLPISGTNIRGLRAGYQDRFPSDFEQFGYQEQTLDEMIHEALQEQA